MMLCLALPLFASDITFSGGYTKVSLQDGNHTVTLSEEAKVETEEIMLCADSVELYGPDYCYVSCKGNVDVTEKERDIKLSCTNLFYNRNDSTLLSNGWIEIEDVNNEAQLSGSWLEYSTDTSIMKLQIQAQINKNTDSGLLSCTADSIEYDADNQKLILKGYSKVSWGDDHYEASMIIVDIDTEDITLHGSISGEVNG